MRKRNKRKKAKKTAGAIRRCGIANIRGLMIGLMTPRDKHIF